MKNPMGRSIEYVILRATLWNFHFAFINALAKPVRHRICYPIFGDRIPRLWNPTGWRSQPAQYKHTTRTRDRESTLFPSIPKVQILNRDGRLGCVTSCMWTTSYTRSDGHQLEVSLESYPQVWALSLDLDRLLIPALHLHRDGLYYFVLHFIFSLVAIPWFSWCSKRHNVTDESNQQPQCWYQPGGVTKMGCWFNNRSAQY